MIRLYNVFLQVSKSSLIIQNDSWGLSCCPHLKLQDGLQDDGAVHVDEVFLVQGCQVCTVSWQQAQAQDTEVFLVLLRAFEGCFQILEHNGSIIQIWSIRHQTIMKKKQNETNALFSIIGIPNWSPK
jgi:hypothetical protein